MPTQEQVEDKLLEVMDPELHMSIMDLGLVYEVSVREDKVSIQMTLTTLGCPLFETIEEDIKQKLGEIHVKPEHVKIDLTFDPPWSMDRMSERGKAMLGI